MHSENPILDYLNAIYRYRLVTVCVVVVGAILTLWTVRVLPNVYTSTTLIMVEPQDVPQTFVKTTVTTRVEERLNALSQEVLSRTRLEAIIDDLDLFRDRRDQGVPRESIVEGMRNRIQIQVFPRDNAFRISYDAHEPIVAQQVTSRLAALYIDENLRTREQRVVGTTEFLENELEKVKQQLEEQEARIQGYKEQYMGELPEQRQVNMNALSGLRLQLQTIGMALSSAMERKLLLEREASDLRASGSTRVRSDGLPSADPRQRLQEFEAQLGELRGRYTEEHPDVVSLQSQIDQLRAEMTADDGSRPADMKPLLPTQLVRSLAEVRLQIKRLNAEKENAEKAIQAYLTRVENAFKREQELLILTRDYEVTHKTYQTMLDKSLEARLSQSLERRQKGERFRVLDPANLPQTPSRPNRSFLIMAGLAGSLGLAILLPILLRQMDTSFHVADDLVACSIPVLAVIPRVSTTSVRWRNWRYRMQVLGLSAVGLLAGLATVKLYEHYLF